MLFARMCACPQAHSYKSHRGAQGTGAVGGLGVNGALVLLTALARSLRLGTVELQGGSLTLPWSSHNQFQMAVNVGGSEEDMNAQFRGSQRSSSCCGRNTSQGLWVAHDRADTFSWTVG